MVEQLSYEEFEKLVNKKFRVNGYEEEIEIELYEVSDRKITPQQEIFSLLFRGSNDKFLPQNMYSLSSEDISDATIFLVPIGQNEAETTYQAVFNRLVKS